MFVRSAMIVALLGLAGCAGVAPVTDAAPAPPPPAAFSAPAPVAEADQNVAPPPVAAAGVNIATPAPPPPRDDEDDIVVPGQQENQVQPPNGDPRNRIERMADIRAWDRCVSRAQAVFEDDPMSPQLDPPEEVCRRQLGMADRDAVPNSRLRRR